jgi:glycosyltransferase involved in cell wall biosynthesis
MRLIASLASSEVIQEVIVVDDASDEPVEAEGRSIRVVRNERPLHVSASRNRGASLVRTHFVLFIDDD